MWMSLSLAFLAPDIVKAAVERRLPVAVVSSADPLARAQPPRSSCGIDAFSPSGKALNLSMSQLDQRVIAMGAGYSYSLK